VRLTPALAALPLLAAMGACTEAPGTPLAAYPVGPPEWGAVVDRATDTWNEAADSLGCDRPFRPDGAPYPVTLVPDDLWTGPANRCGVARADGAEVRVSCGVPRGDLEPNGALHELGHAVGLDHAPPGVPAVMAPYVSDLWTPTAWDVQALKTLCNLEIP
jgi:hypothetical protein